MIAIVCGDAGGRASLVTTPENLAKHPWMKEDKQSCVELYCIRGASWTEIMEEYYSNQGWGPYVSIREPGEPPPPPEEDLG